MIDKMLILLAGMTAIYFGGRWFVEGASQLAVAFGVKPLVIGLTVVAIGSSAPELFIGLAAGLEGVGTVSLGNVIGANIGNATYILGICAIIVPIAISYKVIRKEGFVVLAAVSLTLILALDGSLSMIDGVIMIGAFIIYLVVMVRSLRMSKPDKAIVSEFEEFARPMRKPLVSTLILSVGLVMLIVGSQVSIDSAAGLVRNLGISEFIIGLTVITFGTTLPELTVSVVAAIKRETDIAVGNVLGSLVFNTLVVTGVGGILQGLDVPFDLILRGFVPLLLFTVLLLCIIFRKDGLGRRSGFLLIASYVVYLALAMISM